MNHLFPILTALAYLKFCLYIRFLATGKKLTGRLGTLFLGLGLVAHYLRFWRGPAVCTRFRTMTCTDPCRSLVGF